MAGSNCGPGMKKGGKKKSLGKGGKLMGGGRY